MKLSIHVQLMALMKFTQLVIWTFQMASIYFKMA